MTNLFIPKIGILLLPLLLVTGNINPNVELFQENKSLKIEKNEKTQIQDSYVFTAEADIFNSAGSGCTSYQIRIYATNTTTRQRRLIHSAIVLSGIGCGDREGQVLLSTTYFGTKSLPDYLLKDERPDDKPIIPFLKEHPKVYEEYVLKREKLQN
ncbi:hypothetical protein GCM10007424_03580 [Flavobacterium suaedae]|uniref:Uncharacterized protein n=1 Tax=Flavobacterium suaedae TaxID=1767027 RepID=A0ABQ1JEZ9_9FLAO|nr:hypothetical protein [Flavobacterium suaedae]GGB66875.1 hypothetical protein GCM10007424_03580 [Flavobacterium suaedae]